MYHSWLDRWDERRARRGEEGKKTTDFVLDAERAFPGAKKITSIEGFCALADQAVADPAFFDEPSVSDQGFERLDGWLKFPSDIFTDIEQNNVVPAKITESGSFNQAMVIFHHWNASARNRQIANFFSQSGITVVEIAMPYHFERSRPGSVHADYMLSPNLGRTIQSVRQAVLDGRKLIRWLKSEGYREISVLGMSLGSWVAAVVAAHDLSVSKASLFLTAGSLADMVWTGRATRSIRDSLEPEIELTDLRRAWGPLDLENYAHSLARPGLDLQVVLAKRDKVVLPELSERFMQMLKDAGARPNILELNCGHYSLAMPPYILLAGLSLKRLLTRGR
ncbi:dienelactone hydrolase-related enzyme (plasmid) [Mesorhizobium mediterraneum]|uniref:Dienelactone hydrolase-related enzyme n=2 Tax=Mesorhizobium TaxID=68287 RepID=A0AB36RH90_9HYPH|nr:MULTISPECIES: dienelactone hydrolase-related enzyme [Mesorhizobium]PAQ04302.1 dienelactone hydrolase-related enzyme [Mesorhizobium mediterraneum]RUU85144.1 dienelactone hydrolase-related enzyme [Mesorhizobium sp. M7A.F.Ca.MR.176.00.0.0]RWA99554.1 MAG: dienelactone hydrolase-related enzyme [Mesorhizobium sp.]RWN24600.1 MAG: dienelactone hydrolase-related enzyme [Mesorhizobium sp.]RWN28317.1 MAG: dienelactone hydrolase-related enzyme [Mesorhizobium sp.]